MVIYPNDHRPAHVHVIGGEGELVFDLHCPDGPVEVREVYSFSRAEVGRIKIDLQARLSALCAEWERIHGRP